MKNQTFKLNSVLLAFSAAFVLGACGGSGGGSDSGSANNGGSNNGGNNGGGPVSTCANGATDYPNCTVLPLQTSVPTPTYLPNSVELQAFTEINAVRQKLGLGLWAQSKELDTAAKNHVNYIVVNMPSDLTAFGHFEVQGKPGFTGAGPGERARFANFSGNAGEVVGVPENKVLLLSHTFNLLNTVGHAQLLLDQCAAFVGLGYLPFFFQNLNYDPLVINNGSKNTSSGLSICQKNKDDFSYEFPFDGMNNVPVSMTGEVPNPIPDLPKDQFGNDDWRNGSSAPVIIGFEKSKTIESINATVTEVPSKTVVPMRLLWWQSSTYPNPYKDKYIAFLVGYKPFKSQTKYQVLYNATVSGISYSKTFSFVTK